MYHFQIDMTDETAEALFAVMNRTGDDPITVFRKALGLYKLAMEARLEGKSVGATAAPDSLETEFVGLK